MHLCIVSPALAPGGAQRLVLEEAKYFHAQSYEVTILTPQYDPDFFAELAVPGEITTIEYGESDSVASFTGRVRSIRKHLRDLNPDLACSHNRGREVYLATRFQDIDYTCHVNGSPFWFPNNPSLVAHMRIDGFDRCLQDVRGHRDFQTDLNLSAPYRVKEEFSEYLQRKAFQNSQAVFTLTEQVRKELKMLYGVDAIVARPGVAKNWFGGSESIPEKSITDQEKTILNVGRLDERKRNGLLLRAFAELRERRSDVGLVIAGSGEEGDRLKSLAKSLGVFDVVEFPGYVPEEDLPAYYKAADVFGHPAWVAYGLAPLEAYLMDSKVAISTDTLVKEIIGGEPGVTITEPVREAWVDSLDQLLGSERVDPAEEAVPSWGDFGSRKSQEIGR